jgi:hypothetical protein
MGKLAVAPAMISRPAMRMVTLSMLNMAALVQIGGVKQVRVIAVGGSRCRFVSMSGNDWATETVS